MASLEDGWDYSRNIYRVVYFHDENGFNDWEQRKFRLNIPKMEDSEYNKLSAFWKGYFDEHDEEEVMEAIVSLLKEVA